MRTITDVMDSALVNYLIAEYGCSRDTKAVKVAPGQYGISYHEQVPIGDIRTLWTDAPPTTKMPPILHKEFVQVGASFDSGKSTVSYWIAYAHEIDTLYWWR